ncbi:hypothetical protein HJA77_12175 [Rhizobium bangladeshense]|nr:hypothetical protein [Rhizobium bangladeshense]MBY3581918.1 hypothetical protein [Rhizobium bangladeshense]QSY90860.1 hypothetical protein J2J98_23020 [Rhizobium bangladeshense]
MFSIRFPVVLPSVIASINQNAMMAFEMAIIAGIVASGEFREAIYDAIRTLDIALSINASVAIVVLTMVMDRIAESASCLGTGRVMNSWHLLPPCFRASRLGAGDLAQHYLRRRSWLAGVRYRIR